MNDFEFKRVSNSPRFAGQISVSFDTPVGKVGTSTAEGCLLWLLLEEIKGLRADLARTSTGEA